VQRIATFMMVKPGMEEQYVAEHRDIWPEVLAGITRFGIHSYSIFMNGRELYSYFEVEDLQKTMALAAADPDNQRWQVHMADFFDVGPGMNDGSTVYPVEIFHAPGDDMLLRPFQRIGGLHQLKPGRDVAMRQLCEATPPEVYDTIRQAGIRNDCIYLVGQTLFTYYQTQDPRHSHELLAADANYKAWHMSLADCIEGGASIIMDEVFYVA
jgi:L-rhamnose mutarotase